jgi:hypothetical protein
MSPRTGSPPAGLRSPSRRTEGRSKCTGQAGAEAADKIPALRSVPARGGHHLGRMSKELPDYAEWLTVGVATAESVLRGSLPKETRRC